MEWRSVGASSSKRQWCGSSLYYSGEKEMAASAVVGANTASWKVGTLLVKAWEVTNTAGPSAGDLVISQGERDAATKHASTWHRLSRGEPSGLRALQPVDMLVMSSSVSGSSYRSVVTFSGQGRLNDILTWNKAKGCVNSKYKKNTACQSVTVKLKHRSDQTFPHRSEKLESNAKLREKWLIK